MSESPSQSTELIADRIRNAFTQHDLEATGSLFAPEARWGNCVGGDQIVQWMQQTITDGIELTLVDAEPRADRVILTLGWRQTASGDAASTQSGTHHQIAFVVDGQITELQDATDRDEALRATPSAPPPSPLGPRSHITTATAILPVRELATALEHYRRLGFTVRRYEGGGYGFIERGDVELHVGEVPHLDPSTNLAAVYLYVEDADALHAEWNAANGAGELIAPTTTEYGMYEGAHVDPDGNRIRFGTPLPD